MLILTRRPKEAFLIGKSVSVTVISVKGNQVRLAIKAPETTHIERGDVQKKDQELLTKN
ncbi:carbon storage regulator [Methylophaga sp. OBS3]|uniref:carbon storage regulator n=1 Tax=Methylophaga sp. OBS3 TaxID=2991934 RepID=UPI0022561AA8|nr:carbon storage regulator [Methylophaga sp. OBS3]MCX4189004.1 carbon storage regulator [Methylophaga sp. OBS3]